MSDDLYFGTISDGGIVYASGGKRRRSTGSPFQSGRKVPPKKQVVREVIDRASGPQPITITIIPPNDFRGRLGSDWEQAWPMADHDDLPMHRCGHGLTRPAGSPRCACWADELSRERNAA